MSEKKQPICALCKVRKCNSSEITQSYPVFCTRLNYSDIRDKTIKQNWENSEVKKLNQATDALLKKYHDGERLTRVEELIEYAKMLKYRKLGLAFCVGLWEEARILHEILVNKGFQVVSGACSIGATTQDDADGNPRIICNPLTQAEVLNQEDTELNIVLGLCIGHDVLFIKNSKADVTVLVVKDRVTGNNPVAALYTAHSYYRKQLT
jgi:uncharacterized metal-binding protein